MEYATKPPKGENYRKAADLPVQLLNHDRICEAVVFVFYPRTGAFGQPEAIEGWRAQENNSIMFLDETNIISPN